MSTPLQVIDGIETRLATISGLRVVDYVPDQINPPCAFIDAPSIDYLGAMGRGMVTHTHRVVILVSSASDRAGQKALLAYAANTGTSSIPAAVWADRTLGLSDCAAQVSGFEPFGVDEIGAYKFYGGTFTLTVHTKGT